jgi:hypothetical protein
MDETTKGGKMMDTTKLFERYLAKDNLTREIIFARLYGRMEKSTRFEADMFFDELEDILEKEVNEE